MKTAKTVFSVLTFVCVPAIAIFSFFSVFLGSEEFGDMVVNSMSGDEFFKIVLISGIVTPLTVIAAGVIELSLKRTSYGGFISGGLLLALFLWYRLFLCKAIDNVGMKVIPYMLIIPCAVFILIALFETMKNRSDY